MNWLVLCCCRYKKGTFGGSWRLPLLLPRKAGPGQTSWGSGIQRVSTPETLLAPFLPLLLSVSWDCERKPEAASGAGRGSGGQDVRQYPVHMTVWGKEGQACILELSSA